MSQREDKVREFQKGMQAGCSAFAWETEDGRHLFGRNFDFNRLAQGSQVLYIPKGQNFYTYGTELENSLDEKTRQTGRYAAVGIGAGFFPSTPVLYEGMNEKGLMGGQLFYRNFACFENGKKADRLAVHPAFAVTYFLARCESVRQVAKELEENISLVGTPLLGTVPTIHWMFTDRSGESIVVESERDGLHIYRNTIGVMTNAPGYGWHRQNLLNYAQIRDLDHEAVEIAGTRLEQCFSGSGAFGLPGDWSSPSRFVRLAFLKKYAVKGKNEEEGIAYLFRLLGNAAFPYGMVRVTESGVVTEYDREVTPYDYTIYTSAMCAESLRFYWTTYEDSRVRYVDLETLRERKAVLQMELNRKPEFLCVTGDMNPRQSP